MLVIGTAGHIDHGKSSIVNCLTGSDPDRLPEEKRRGMTIDLGFAFMESALEGGQELAFVDVPGHERFVKNMISGAGGIDFVLLIVAADDGWMPQSEEHFQIVRMLGIKHGAVVINKIDLARPDWLDLLENDIKEKVKNSFLDNSPVFRVSSVTNEGMDKLKRYLQNLPGQLSGPDDRGEARLYIDRSFVRQGIGGVVTGTLKHGRLSVAQQISIWPSQKKAKIRTLHANNKEVETATAGQRTAVSFTGVDKTDLIRGGVICSKGNLSHYVTNKVLLLSVELLGNSPIILKDRRRLLALCGTQEVEGEIRILSDKTIKPNQRGHLFFKPDRPILTNRGDRIILRLPTPMITIGGAEVAGHFKMFPRQKDHRRYIQLTEISDQSIENIISADISFYKAIKADSFLNFTNTSDEEIRKNLSEKIKNNEIVEFNSYLLDSSAIKTFQEKINALFSGSGQDRAEALSFKTAELKNHFPDYADSLPVFLDYLTEGGLLELSGGSYTIKSEKIDIPPEIKKIYDEIKGVLVEAMYTPPKLREFADKGKKEREAIRYLLQSKEVYKCGTDFLFIAKSWKEIIAFIKETLGRTNQITVADLKNKFNLSRKYVIPILEETDKLGLTKREGEARVKGNKFEK